MIMLKHSSGQVKECPTGFSWTTFFFGVFVPLIRGDFKWAGIMLVACVVAACIFSSGLGSWIICIGMASCYNKLYIKDMLEKGWTAADDTARTWLVANGIIVNNIANNDVNNNISNDTINLNKE